MSDQLTLQGVNPEEAKKERHRQPEDGADEYVVRILVEMNGKPVIDKEIDAEIYQSRVANATSIVIPGQFCSLDREGNSQIWTR